MNTPSTSKSWGYRLFAITQDLAMKGLNAGFISGWIYDITFASIAADLVEEAVTTGADYDQCEKLVADLEATDFFIFGNPNYTSRVDETKIKENFAIDIVTPLYNAFLSNERVYQQYNGAESMFIFILDQWIPKD